MPSLQALPARDIPWSTDTLRAVQILRDTYQFINDFLSQGNYDVHRVRLHATRIADNIAPLLATMEAASSVEGIPLDWLYDCANRFHDIFTQLNNAEFEAQDGEITGIGIAKPVTVKRTGKRGRPRKIINQEFLRDAMNPSRHITIKRLSGVLGVHRNTLRQRLKDADVDHSFSRLSNHHLDKLVKEFRVRYPASGRRYLFGHFRCLGLRIQKQRITSSMHRIERLGKALRQPKFTPQRKEYKVARPNALWHIDGHHKMILWGIVIHGVVDGFSRAVTGLRANTNNRAPTVLEMFLDAISKYGIPSRVRGDYGGENRDVSVLMILLRGFNRASFMWGSSTYNTRIERLWVEVGKQFARPWRAFFCRLERLHHLDRANPQHLWLLHLLFLDQINDDCEEFQRDWNSHPISGKEAGEQSPNIKDLRFLGQLENGVYIGNDCDGLSPDELNKFYGIAGHRTTRRRGQTGAGHPADEEDSDEEDLDSDDPDCLDNQLAEEQSCHVHDPVDVPKHAIPFDSDSARDVFIGTLWQIHTNGIVPTGYGVCPDEWDASGYSPFECIRAGRKQTKELSIPLTQSVWLPRAQLWVQGLHTLYRVLDMELDGTLA